MKKRNSGFTLVEMIVIVSISAILIGILVPSLNTVLGLNAQRTTNALASALDKTKTEAMSRLVGVMKLSHEEDGYYVTYYLDYGEGTGVKEGGREKISNNRVKIYYIVDGSSIYLDVGDSNSIVISYDRDSGGFLPLLNGTQEKQLETALSAEKDITFATLGAYCEKINIVGGMRSRLITLNKDSGTYTITAN